MPTYAYGQWVKKADELYQTAEGNNVVYHNKLYVFGGFSKNPLIEKRNEVYDIKSNTWSPIATFPAGREVTHNGIILVDDNVWLIGGRAVDSHGPVTSQVLIYNITTDKWTEGPEIIDPATGNAFALGGGGYALLGRTIHIFGGFGPSICDDQAKLHLTLDVDKYAVNPQHTTWENKLSPMPIPRNHISYIVLGGKIYAFGGQFKHDCGAVDQKYCHVYDPGTDTWTRLADLPVARSHAEASSFALDGKILLIAGQGPQDIPQSTVYEFTPLANNGMGTWTKTTKYKLPGNYLGLSSKVIADQIIITNGALNNYANSRKETYAFRVPRVSARTLGFVTSCFSETVDAGSKVTVKNLLYALEDSVSCTVTTDQSWLSVAEDFNGMVNLNGKEIQIIVNTAHLLPGKYTGQIKATGKNVSKPVTCCFNLEVKAGTGYNLTVTTKGNGTINRTPDQSSYDPGSAVKIIAKPAIGWKFESWTGDTTAQINPLTVNLNANKIINANFIKTEVEAGLITIISPSTNNSYFLGTLSKGTEYYSDRSYSLITVPDGYNDLTSIVTANDDKLSNAEKILSFVLSDTATVFIAYDSRAAAIPAWLKSWQILADKIAVSDPKLGHFNIFSKNFSAGSTVIIGGNLQRPASGALCNYFVFAKAESIKADMLTKAFQELIPDSFYQVTREQDNSVSQNKDRLVIYPNPAKDHFRIIMPENFTEILSLSITDMFGKSQYLQGTDFSVDGKIVMVKSSLFFLKQGLYSLTITSTKGKSYSAKLIVD